MLYYADHEELLLREFIWIQNLFTESRYVVSVMCMLTLHKSTWIHQAFDTL
jgi:hypothetical protein